MEAATAKGIHLVPSANVLTHRGPSSPSVYKKYELDTWLEVLARELARLRDDERRDIDTVFAGLEPAFQEHGWSGAYWEADGPVVVLRQVIAPDMAHAEFTIPFAGVALGRTKVPCVFEVVDARATRFVQRLSGPEPGVPLFTTGAFIPVFEGDAVGGVLAIAGPGLGTGDLPAAHVIAHHLATLLAAAPDPSGSPSVGLGRVSALIASEIREPVRNLASLSGRLRERLSRDPALGSLSMDLDRGATRLRLLLEDLLDYTRPLTPWKEAVPLDVVVRSVLASVQRVYREACAGRSLVLEVERPAPMARVDPALLSRALSNVIVNVAERTPPSSSISVTVISKSDQARIQVHADGYEPRRPDPVEPFDALSPALRRRHAIGLAVARRLTRGAGGRLVLERRRTGVSYSFRFPEIAT